MRYAGLRFGGAVLIHFMVVMPRLTGLKSLRNKILHAELDAKVWVSRCGGCARFTFKKIH